jgi:TPR repeat protein
MRTSLRDEAGFGEGLVMGDQGKALAEGLYWMAEKLMWGYEDTDINHVEAFRVYKRAADLGFSDALIRVGELQEHGKGTEQSAAEALASYQRAAKAGNFLAYAYIGKLLTRTQHAGKADRSWSKFFAILELNPKHEFVADTPGGLIHDYIESQLRLGVEPNYIQTIRQFRNDVVARNQQLLEHASSPNRLERIGAVTDWLIANLRDE